ncbi:MAG: hypothetical protein QG670_2418 [Thermoproteota archaeon]|nr:hypothetical protein [Thermoproteota archaeon]
MSYIIFAKGVSSRFDEFVKELSSGLARKGVNISNQTSRTGEVAMSVKYTDESGDMCITSNQPDIKISYTASGGPETLKGAVTGAAAGGGLGVLTGVLTGKTKPDRVLTGFAGAVTGGAVGAYKGHEKGMKEKISFAKLLAMTVTDSERRLLNIERIEIAARDKNARLKDNLLTEKANVESMIERSLGLLDSMKSEEESKKTTAEANHLERTARLEANASQSKDLINRMLEAEKKRFEAELKRIESYYIMRTAQVNSNVSRLRHRVTTIENKLATL